MLKRWKLLNQLRGYKKLDNQGCATKRTTLVNHALTKSQSLKLCHAFFKAVPSKGEMRGVARSASQGPLLILMGLQGVLTACNTGRASAWALGKTVRVLCMRPKETSLKSFLEFRPQKTIPYIPSHFLLLSCILLQRH